MVDLLAVHVSGTDRPNEGEPVADPEREDQEHMAAGIRGSNGFEAFLSSGMLRIR